MSSIANFPEAAAAAPELSVRNIAARLERIPPTSLHVKARIIVGTATFFDGFGTLAIAAALPALIGPWKLAPTDIGFLIASGFAGMMLGALFFPRVAEKTGRIPAASWSIVLIAAASILCGLSWNYTSLCTFRFIQGLGLGGEVPVAATYINELCRARGRGRFFLLYELVFPFGLFLSSVVGAWVVPRFGWSAMFYIGALPALLVIPIRRTMPESPRWLATHGRLAEADAVTAQFERAAGPGLPPVLPDLLPPAPEAQSFHWQELIRAPYLRRTVVLWINWIAVAVISFALGAWIPTIYRTVFKLSLHDSLELAQVMTVCGLIGSVAAAFAIDPLGRRPWLAFTQIAGGISVAIVAFVPAPSLTLVAICSSFAYGFSSSAFMVLFVYTPESYPTRFRAVGTGTASAWSRAASIAAPAIVGFILASSNLQVVFAFYAVASIVAGIVVAFFGIETKEKALEAIAT